MILMLRSGTVAIHPPCSLSLNLALTFLPGNRILKALRSSAATSCSRALVVAAAAVPPFRRGAVNGNQAGSVIARQGGLSRHLFQLLSSFPVPLAHMRSSRWFCFAAFNDAQPPCRHLQRGQLGWVHIFFFSLWDQSATCFVA